MGLSVKRDKPCRKRQRKWMEFKYGFPIAEPGKMIQIMGLGCVATIKGNFHCEQQQGESSEDRFSAASPASLVYRIPLGKGRSTNR